MKKKKDESVFFEEINKDKDNKFGNMIRALRKEKGLTQTELSEKIFVSDRAISRWERGETYPSMEGVFQLSKFFNVDFNELMALRADSNGDNTEITENIIREFKEIDKKQKRLIKRILIISTCIVLFLVAVIIFTNTYNRFKVYRVSFESEDVYYSNGLYVETNVRDELFLNDIKFRNIDTDDITDAKVTLYYLDNDKENVLKEFDVINNLYFLNHTDYTNINNLSDYFDKLYLKIIVNTINEVNKEFYVKLNFTKDFSNNKIYYDYKGYESLNTNNESSNDIEKKLLDNGFEYDSNYVLINKSEKCTMSFDLRTNYVTIYYDENNYYITIKYYLEKNTMYAKITNDNFTVIEKYDYNFNDKNMNCEVGLCNDYDKLYKIVDEYFLSLIK